MRVAPVALATRWDAWDLGCRAAAITHTHPSGYLAAGALSVILSSLLHERTLTQAVDAAIAKLKAEPHGSEVRTLLEQAMYAAELGPADTAQIAELGEGWIAEEALAIGVYCAAVVERFEDGVALAVTHNGDSDSTGSITGQILGTVYGIHGVPLTLRAGLELHDEIERIADDLYHHFWSADFAPNDDDWARYPG